MKRALVAANLLAVVLLIGYGLIEFGSPAVAARLWREDYKNLMFKCDQAMRDHYIAKQAVKLEPGKDTIQNLQASEVALLDCHEYDKGRKRLLAWGLSEAKLSLIGLEALESKSYELRRFVELHEIRY